MQTETLSKENKMGTMPMMQLFFSMTVPMMISMLVQALYNVVDSVFISHYSEAALQALSCAYPMQNLMIGVATGTAVGLNSLLSRSLGEKNQDLVNRVAQHGVFLAGAGYLVFLILGLFFTRPFLALQTSDEAVIQAGVEYLTVVCCLSFGVFFQIIFERMLQSTGRTLLTMYTQGLGAVLNIILDPIFIFDRGAEIFGFTMPVGLGMGAAGAAIATVIGQIAAAILALFFNIRFNHDISLSHTRFRPSREVISRIYAIGIPSMIMVGIGTIMTTVMNIILDTFSGMAVSVFGIYFKLQSFIFMPIFGMNNGVIPILAYSYGAGRRKRFLHAMGIMYTTALLFMLAGTLLMQLVPDFFLSFFDANEEMLRIGIPALRTLSLSFILAAMSIGSISVFQALGRGIYAMVISVARQLVVLLPVAALLAFTVKELDAVWYAFPIAEFASVIVALFLLIRLWKQVIRYIPEDGETKKDVPASSDIN